MEKLILLYGIPKGETERYTESLLYTQGKTMADIEHVKTIASRDGWHSFRIAYSDGSPPDFTGTVKK
jgi:hypothetical protein